MPTRTAAQADLRAMQRADALAQAVVLVAPPQRWTHGQEEAPAVIRRGYTHVASGIRALHDDDSIGDAAFAAARRFGLDYTIGVEGCRIASKSLRSGRADCHDVAIGRSEAVTRHHAIARLLGPPATELLVVFIVVDLSIAAVQRQYLPVPPPGHEWAVRTAREEIKVQIVELLRALPGLYSRIDRHSGKRPDAGEDDEQFGE
jgi:hypothetical protein